MGAISSHISENSCLCVQKTIYALNCAQIPQKIFERFVCPKHNPNEPLVSPATPDTDRSDEPLVSSATPDTDNSNEPPVSPAAQDTDGYVQCILHPDVLLTQSENVNEWKVCYHGASLAIIYSILRHGEFLMEGDVLLDGNYLTARHLHSSDQKPAIWTYPKREDVDELCVQAMFDKNETAFKILLQLRQRPQSYTSYTTNKGFEVWSTNRRGVIIIEAVHINVIKSKHVASPKPLIRIPTKIYATTFKCPIQREAFEVLTTLNLPKALFNSQFNRCYCKACYPGILPNSMIRGGEKYVIPKGWVRFALAVNPVMAAINDIWDSWYIAFHGCKVADVESIVKHRSLLIPHDYLSDGRELGVNSSKDSNQKCYFLSPSIGYAAHPWYARPSQCGDKYIQVVLALKVRPGSIDKQQETEGGAMKIFDDYSEIREDEIEWYSSQRGCNHVYGLLMRIMTKPEYDKILTYYNVQPPNQVSFVRKKKPV